MVSKADILTPFQVLLYTPAPNCRLGYRLPTLQVNFLKMSPKAYFTLNSRGPNETQLSAIIVLHALACLLIRLVPPAEPSESPGEYSSSGLQGLADFS